MRQLFKQVTLATGLLLTLISMTVAVSAQVQPDELPTYFSRLEAMGLSGAFLVEQGGEVILHDGYGLADLFNGQANTADTIFEIGSVTKNFTATAIALLVAEEQIDLNAPISEYLPDVPDDKADITVLQLLRHTAGLEEYHDTSGDFQPMSRDTAQRLILNSALIAEPDTAQNYSNSGYTLLAMLIESVSGETYTDYLHEHIFTPLGMMRTGFMGESFDNMASSTNAVYGYSTPADWDYTWALIGAGGMVSTVGDLRTFVNAMIGQDFLPQAIKEATGLMPENGIFSAGGSSATQFVASFVYDPPTDTLIIGLTNTWEFPSEAVLESLYQSLQSNSLRMPPEIVTLEESQLQALAGDYVLPDDGMLRVSYNEISLTLDVIGQYAINVLSNADEDAIQRADAYNQLVTALTDALRTGEIDAVASSVEATNPFLAEVARQLAQNIAVPEQLTVDNYGTARLSEQGEMQTVAHLTSGDDGILLLLIWSEDGELVGADFRDANDSVTPLSIKYYPTSETTFASYDATQIRPDLTLDDDQTLVFTLGDAQLIAHK